MRELMERFSWIIRIAFASNGAIDSTFNRSNCFSGESGIVSVTTNSLMGDSFKRSTAGPDKTAWVQQA
jgi:hypothetical protein